MANYHPFNIARVPIMDYREFPHPDQVIAVAPQPCHDCRSMDDLHRIHIDRLKSDLEHRAKTAESAGYWKMAAFAAFALVLLIGWAR